MHRVCRRVVALALPAGLAACSTNNAPSGAIEPNGSGPAAAFRAAALFAGPPLPPPNEFRTAAGAPGPAYWQQQADYTIRATLDAPARRIVANETMVYTNNSPAALPFIWINLEQNLFRTDSDGARMSTPNGRFGNRDQFHGGFEDVKVTLAGSAGRDLRLHDYGTVGRIDLPEPIAPRGGRITIEFAWSFDIPAYGSDRMGIDDTQHGPVFQLAQWFPSACVFDDVHGWNTLPYLGQGEFYTNYGTYDVSLTVPRGHIVAATGELANPEEVLSPLQQERLSSARATSETVVIRGADEIGADAGEPAGETGGATSTWRFRADNVRTFAWASSAAFAWDACFVPGGGKGSDGDPARGQGTLCQSFYPTEAAAIWSAKGQGGGSTQMLRKSLEHYGKKWYAYPYPSASNVNGIVGGMEYPMIVFCGGRDPGGERGLWGVTTHEIGHNWFPMLINTDERRHAWMDEGFNTFINYYATLERYPDDLPRRGNPRRWARDNPKPMPQAIDIPADQVERGQLGTLQYAKTAAGLTLLREGVLGEARFDAAFREYLRRWAFKSPRPWDFFRTMQDVAGEDLGWFFRGWFYETGVLDQAVTTVMQPGGAEGHAESRAARVTFRNRGGLVMPVVFKVEYDDGSDEVRRLPIAVWFNGDTWQTQWDTRNTAGQVRRIKRIEIDPDSDFPDVEPRNNVWP
ncbi:MAG: M1 family metallopeptidase [Phycisphaerales bacterium]|nr:M1 family metallopeptidase [Phycisphaerales bacterium]